MRDHSNHIQVNREEAIELILKHCKFEPKTEVIPVQESVGRVLAEDIRAQWDNPNCLTCAMDSVAVHWSDFENGMPDTTDWERGKQWEFANTGVGMPEGFDTAIVVEHVIFSENDTKVAFDAMPSAQYAGTIKPGSRMKKGDLLVLAGAKITPLLAAHITSANYTQVKVLKRPRVAFIPTGGELVSAGGEIPRGKNIESNSLMIAGKIREWGGEPICFDVVPDKQDLIKLALCTAAEQADIIVLNAGSSKGNDDWGIEMLEEIGTIFYHQICHGPGHHSAFGLIGDTPVIGISGPPGGAAPTTDFYLYPAVMTYLGLAPRLKKIRVRAGADLSPGKPPMAKKDSGKPGKPAGENRPREGGEFSVIRQVQLKPADDGVMEAFPLRKMHPGPVEAESADAYYMMPTGTNGTPAKAGEWIEVEVRP